MRIFYFVGKSGAKQRHMGVTCDVFPFRKALQKTHILIGSKELASGKRFATLMEAAGESKS